MEKLKIILYTDVDVNTFPDTAAHPQEKRGSHGSAAA
jgi:hypothetical protein